LLQKIEKNSLIKNIYGFVFLERDLPEIFTLKVRNFGCRARTPKKPGVASAGGRSYKWHVRLQALMGEKRFFRPHGRNFYRIIIPFSKNEVYSIAHFLVYNSSRYRYFKCTILIFENANFAAFCG